MKLFLACFAAILLAVGIADAAPRDLVAVTGTVSHETRDQFIVLRGDDGKRYYIDVSRADRTPGTVNLSPNEKIGVIGAQGARNDEIRAYIIDRFDNKPTVAQGFTDAPTLEAGEDPADLLARVEDMSDEEVERRLSEMTAQGHG